MKNYLAGKRQSVSVFCLATRAILPCEIAYFVIYAVVNRRFRYAYKLLLTCRKYDPAEIAF